MDTREKIVGLPQAKALLAHGDWTAIVGLFDPLTATQARRIESCKGSGKLLLVVLDAPDTLLPVDARWQLVAALRPVDCVLPATERDWRSSIIQNGSVQVISDWEAERRRSQDFIELIASRQGH